MQEADLIPGIESITRPRRSLEGPLLPAIESIMEARRASDSIDHFSEKSDGLAPPPSKSKRFRAVLAKLTLKCYSSRKQAAAAAAAAAEIETQRRREIPATGPEADEHKRGAEDAQRFVAEHSKRLREAPDRRARQKIIDELIEACDDGTIWDRNWWALVTEVPEYLAPEDRRFWKVRKEADQRGKMWRKENGLKDWTFEKGEKKERMRRVSDPLVSVGPTDEVVVAECDVPILDQEVRGRGRCCKMFDRWRGCRWTVRWCAWKLKGI